MRLHQILAVALACVLHMTEALLEDTRDFSFGTSPGLSWLQEMTSGSSKLLSRKKRFIGLPPGSNIEVKWSLNFPFDTFTFYKAKIQLALPIKIPFPEKLIVGGDDKKRRSEGDSNALWGEDSRQDLQYDHWYQQTDNQMDLHLRRRRAARQERSSVYSYLEAAFHKAGMDGQSCLLRAICDVGEAPFDQGLLGEMINTFLSASLAGRPDDPSEGNDYDRFIEAELHGKLNGRCEERYDKCKVSPFDVLPQLLPDVIHSVH